MSEGNTNAYSASALGRNAPNTSSEDRQAAKAVIVLVTGLSCTGKTTLARSLSQRFGLLLFQKDEFKERMFDILCPEGVDTEVISREMSQLLGRFSLGCLEVALEQCARSGTSAIFEANFDSRRFSPRLSEIRERHPFAAIQAHLHGRGDVLLERFIAREKADRHPGHGGLRYLDEIKPTLLRGRDEPLLMHEGDVIEIDTTDLAAVDFTALQVIIEQRLAEVRDAH